MSRFSIRTAVALAGVLSLSLLVAVPAFADYNFIRAFGGPGVGGFGDNGPQAVATDSSGNVYVADSSNDRI